MNEKVLISLRLSYLSVKAHSRLREGNVFICVFRLHYPWPGTTGAVYHPLLVYFTHHPCKCKNFPHSRVAQYNPKMSTSTTHRCRSTQNEYSVCVRSFRTGKWDSIKLFSARPLQKTRQEGSSSKSPPPRRSCQEALDQPQPTQLAPTTWGLVASSETRMIFKIYLQIIKVCQ